MLVSTMKNHPDGEYLGLFSLYNPIFRSHCLIVVCAGDINDGIHSPSIRKTVESPRKPAELPTKHLTEIKICLVVYL